MPTPPKPFKVPDFLQAHGPRHTHLERMKEMSAAEDPAQGFQAFQGHFERVAELPPRPRTFLDMYLRGDVRQIYQDAALRQAHYEDRQREILDALMTGRSTDSPITDNEKNELFLTWLRDTETAQATKDRNAKITGSSNDEIVLENGQTLAEATKEKGPTFEDQDYGDQIIV